MIINGFKRMYALGIKDVNPSPDLKNGRENSQIKNLIIKTASLEVRWMAHVTRRESNNIIIMVVFPITINKVGENIHQ